MFYIERDGGKNALIHFQSLSAGGRTEGTSSPASAGMATAKVRKSLQQIYSELDSPEFLFIDRSYIVNIIQIMKVSDGTAVLKNGAKLPISRAHLQEVKLQINRFWGAHI